MLSHLDYPLVVDLDETLTLTDTLVESILLLIKSSPISVFLLPFWLLKGRAFFKSSIAERVLLSAETLPYNQELVAYLQQQKEQGRPIILATAAHISIAEAVSKHLGLFSKVIATHGEVNLKSEKKLQEIERKVGPDFVYAGDSRADVAIWAAAKAAILVGVSKAITEKVHSVTSVEKVFKGNSFSLLIWLKAIRIHQWLKNLLIFVPLLTAFSFVESDKIAIALMAFFSFSLLASGTYIFNDLWDLPADRIHPRKKNRPFASSAIPAIHGALAALFIMAAALMLAWIISIEFLLMLLLYLLLTTSYSLVFKEYVLMDVILIALLYTTRILAGAIAIQVQTSTWLLAFSVFIFLSLALVKRCSELVSLKVNSINSLQGRDYQVTDLVILWPLGVASALSSVVVFGLFISAPETQARYETPQLLWLVVLGLIYWLSRLWIKTARGEMHDDPVIFAVKNRGSLVSVLGIVLIMIIAHFFSLESIL